MNRPESSYWFAHYSKPLIFLILTLAALGAYLSFTIPVAVFPTTNFPRVLIAADNGVMPIDQMMVTVTRPIEEAVNSVPGLRRSPLHHQPRIGGNRSLLRLERGHVPDPAVRECRHFASASGVAADRDHRDPPHDVRQLSPIIGYSLTSDTVPQTQLWELATYEIKPRLNRLNGVSNVVLQGGQEPEFHIEPDPAKLLTAGVTVTDILDAMKRTNLIDSPGLFERNHQLVLGLISGQVRTPEEIAGVVVKTTPAGVPVRIGDVASVVAGVKPVYTIITANGKPAVLLNINRQPDSNTMRRGRRSTSGAGENPPIAACGNRDQAFLRPVDHRGRIHQERARRDPAGAGVGIDHSGGLPARLGNVDGCGSGDTGDDPDHVCRAQSVGRELQPDDAGRTGGRGGPGD